MIKKILFSFLLCAVTHLCGNPTADSLQMLVALADDWTSTTGFLQRYERISCNDAWFAVGEKISVSFGKNGLGWGIGLHDEYLKDSIFLKKGPRVIEGSKRSPVGVFALHSAFGKAKTSDEDAKNIKLFYTPITSHTRGVDDTKSKYYNRIEDDQLVEKDWDSAEDMQHYADEGLYEFGAFIEHNYDKPIPGKGSCFFIHVHRKPGSPTAGCTAFAREQVREVIYWLDPTKNPILVQFPFKIFNALRKDWDLPRLYTVPFFDAYPLLKDKISHIAFDVYPTPVYNMHTIAQKYGMKAFYVKDDGAQGVLDEQGRTLPSGNKMRKLEFLLAEAKALGYKTVCTVGSAGSNHALETAVCAKLLGLDAVLVLNDQRPTSYTVRNLKLMTLFAKEIKYTTVENDAELLQEAQALCKKEGYYHIPMGGSNPLGALGFVNAMFELKDQINKGVLQEPDFIYVTLGSAGTAAGIIIGTYAAGLKSKIIPVRVSMTVAYKTNLLVSLINQTGTWLKTLDPLFRFVSATPETIGIEHNFAGGEQHVYALATIEAAAAIDTFCTETKNTIGQAIKLDGTYTGKTLSAVFCHAAQGLLKDKVVLFWNTYSYGTFEELTSPVTYEQINKAIPEQLRHYLVDKLQDLDQGI